MWYLVLVPFLLTSNPPEPVALYIVKQMCEDEAKKRNSTEEFLKRNTYAEFECVEAKK